MKFRTLSPIGTLNAESFACPPAHDVPESKNMWRSLERVRRDWNRYAEEDPLWAILTDPRKKERGWDAAEFFETGRREIDELMRYAGTLPAQAGRRRALDFGCGVGRLTRALADHFEEVFGVDISPVMIELAHEHNSHVANCRFVQNPDPGFRALPCREFDLIYSNITLQHMPPRFAKRYLRGMAGMLAPGGLLIFQLPGEERMPLRARVWRTLYEEYRRYILRAHPSMDMFGVRRERVIALFERSGCRILDIAEMPGDPERPNYRYAVVRGRT